MSAFDILCFMTSGEMACLGSRTIQPPVQGGLSVFLHAFHVYSACIPRGFLYFRVFCTVFSGRNVHYIKT